jgi:AraC-like DNA-binding protein
MAILVSKRMRPSSNGPGTTVLYVLDMAADAARRPRLRAWRPEVTGVAEVFHAYFPDHAYPLHTHDTWTLLIVDTGMVRYDLDRHEHGALRSLVTLLPPHVPHDGRSVDAAGFRKRVLYLDEVTLDASRLGSAVDHPGWADLPLRRQIDLLHEALVHPGDTFEADSRLALIRERLTSHLARADLPVVRRDPTLALRLRAMIDDRITTGLTLADAAAALDASETHLVRAFTAELGIAPHQYLIGRRLDLARHRLLAGEPAAEVATDVGFYDQAHLTRHFTRLLGVPPGRFSAGGVGSSPGPDRRASGPAVGAASPRRRRGTG